MNKKTKIPKKRFDIRKSKIIPVTILVVAGLLFASGSGYLGYGLAFVRCGGHQPVIASNFAAAHSYILPGEKFYSPSVFSEYFCTQIEAEKAGFRPQAGTEAGKAQKQEAELREGQRNAEMLKQRDYAVYVPDMQRFSYDDLHVSDIRDEIHTFYRLKKDGTVVAKVRQGKIGSEYEICHNTKYRCEVIGTDARGEEVKQQYPKTDSKTFTLGIRVGDTFINLENAGGDFTVDEALKVLDSLKEME